MSVATSTSAEFVRWFDQVGMDDVDQFTEIFDGFSIGSNELTQLTLGVDRDSEIIAHIFDERNDAVKRAITSVIKTAKAKTSNSSRRFSFKLME